MEGKKEAKKYKKGSRQEKERERERKEREIFIFKASIVFISHASVSLPSLLQPAEEVSPCHPRSYGADSVVCVCSSDYCDFPGVLQAGPAGTYTSVTSSRDGLRFHVESGSFSQSPSNGESPRCLPRVENKRKSRSVGGFEVLGCIRLFSVAV